MATTQYTNRLIDEASPYLLQHAHNPVNWHPWSSLAFDEARRRDKPIFLSIGYATCYWCHVMERECFENEAIAALMNEHFICIKVDREERPDVDDVYMTAVQLLTHQGGWPLSVFLEPQSLMPFLGGTYFPPEDRHGRAGFPSVLRQIADACQNQREAVQTQAERLAHAVTETLSRQPQRTALTPEHVNSAVQLLMNSYDETHGGFGGSSGPKFPMPANLDLLLGTRWNTPNVQLAVTHTLDRMATGGMYDHIGGGFHRYSVDAKWLVPHFEKMLYDNGQLLSTYARAYELTQSPLYEHVLRQTSDFVLREMTHQSGAFYSAQDAEVNQREGLNYLWTATELRETLAEVGEADLAEFALDVYGFNRGTNFRDPHHPEDGPKNVVHLSETPQHMAQRLNLSVEDLYERLGHLNTILREARDRREQPATDDKIIAAWNGLMIAGLADAGRVLDEPRYIHAAAEAANELLTTMMRRDGALMRTVRNGNAGSEGFLEDYACVIHGLLALHRASPLLQQPDHQQQLLDAAESLAATARRLFSDEAGGGYFDTLADQQDLFVRTRSVYDGAMPSPNAVMLLNLLRLHTLTGNDAYLDDAVSTISFLSRFIAEQPIGVVLSVLALHRMFDEHPQTISTLAEPPQEDQPQPVQVAVSSEHVALGAGKASFEVTLHIAPGYHINAHNPGDASVVPLSIETDEAGGVALDVAYPRGTPIKGSASGEQAIAVHYDAVRIPVRVLQTGPLGDPVLRVTYQVCTDQACLSPQREILPVRITEGD